MNPHPKRKQVQKKKKVVNSNNRNSQQHILTVLQKSSVPRSMMATAVLPSQMIGKVCFKQNYIVSSSSNPYAVKDFELNSIFPDPSNTSLASAGVSFYSAGYLLYTVEQVEVQFTVTANEPSLALSFGLTFKDWRPSTMISSYEEAMSALSIAPATGLTSIGETTGSSVYRSPLYRIKPASILGQPLQYYGAPIYSAQTTTVPSSIVWVGFIVIAETPSGTFSNGVKLDFTLVQRVRFYSSTVGLI